MTALKVIDSLTARNIPYEIKEDLFGHAQLLYPSACNCVIDAVCNPLSYGSNEGLLEIMGHNCTAGSLYDDVEGWLTVDEVTNILQQHFTDGCLPE